MRGPGALNVPREVLSREVEVMKAWTQALEEDGGEFASNMEEEDIGFEDEEV